MNRDPSVLRLALAVLPLGFAAAAAAQTTNQTDAAAPALPIPAAPVIALPRPPAPTPSASPTPAPRRTPAARAAAAPTPRATPAARSTPPATLTAAPAASPTPTASPPPRPAATPAARPSPLASPNRAPAPAPPIGDLARTPGETERIEDPSWWAAIVIGVAALAAALFLAWRWSVARRARRAEQELARQPHVIVAGGVPAPSPAEVGDDTSRAGTDVPTFWTPSRPTVAPAPAFAAPADEPPATPPLRPRIATTLHPRRVGVNLVSATADLELTVRNEGDGAAAAVAVSLRLLAGRAGQDGELGELFGAEQGRPVLPPFALAPGEERVCRTTLVLPRAEIEPIPVKGRPMFVPVIAADVRYLRPDGGRGQTAAAFVVGAARAGSDKLSPFWLDAGSKMRDDVEARPHGLAIES